jgi:hypothetical protein
MPRDDAKPSDAYFCLSSNYNECNIEQLDNDRNNKIIIKQQDEDRLESNENSALDGADVRGLRPAVPRPAPRLCLLH